MHEASRRSSVCEETVVGPVYFTEASQMARTIEQQIRATYFALRAGAAAIAFVFPFHEKAL